MENVDIDSLREFLAPSTLEWLEEGKLLTSGLFTDTDEFFDSTPEAELSELERIPLKVAASTREQQQPEYETYNKYLA